MEAVRIECSFCGEELQSNTVDQHQRACLSNPETRRVVKSSVRQLSQGGVLCSEITYNRERDRRAPRSTYVRRVLNATWSEVGVWAGLGALKSREEQLGDALAFIRQLSRELHDGVIGHLPFWALLAKSDEDHNWRRQGSVGKKVRS